MKTVVAGLLAALSLLVAAPAAQASDDPFLDALWAEVNAKESGAAQPNAEPFTTCSDTTITWASWAPASVPAVQARAFDSKVEAALGKITAVTGGRYRFEKVAGVSLENAPISAADQEVAGALYSAMGNPLRASRYVDMTFLFAPLGAPGAGPSDVTTRIHGWGWRGSSKPVRASEDQDAIDVRGSVLGEYSLDQWMSIKSAKRDGSLLQLVQGMLGLSKDVSAPLRANLDATATARLNAQADISCQLHAQRPGISSQLPSALGVEKWLRTG